MQQAMRVSSYLEDALFSEQSPATDALFEDRSDHLFETSSDNSFLDIYSQPQETTTLNTKDPGIGSNKDEAFSCSEPASSPPSPVDHHQYGRESAPRYVGIPGLNQQRITDSNELRDYVQVRLYTAEGFYILIGKT